MNLALGRPTEVVSPMTLASIRSVVTRTAIFQLLLGWAGFVALALTRPLLNGSLSTTALCFLLAALIGIILLCAWGVVTQAEHLATRLADPYGTLALTVLPIVLLSHAMATLLHAVLDRIGAPVALSGVLTAAIIFLPETLTTIQAAQLGEMQRLSNLSHGALVSTVGLTIPVGLTIGLLTDQTVVLVASPANLMLLGMTLVLTIILFSGRNTALHGGVHLMTFTLYLMVVFS